MKKLSKIFAVVLCLTMVMALLPMGASAATEKSIDLTVSSMGLEEQAYAAGTNTVGGVSVEWDHVGNYGNGIQMRDKDGKGTSKIWNTSALGSGITKIELTYSATQEVKYANENCVIFNFGNAAQGTTYSTKLSTTAGVKTYTITPNANTYTYFYMEHDLGYTMYWDSIKVYYNDNGTSSGGNSGSQDPVTPPPATPSNPTIADGEYVIVCPAFNKALSSTKALNQDGSVGFYNAGIDVTVSGNTVSGHGDTEKWIVTNQADGSITISQSGKNLALADKFSSMNLGEVNDKWVLEDAGNGLYYVKNVARGNYIEWYNEMNNWSSYGKINDGSENLFALQFVPLNVQNPSGPNEPNQGTGDLSIAGLVVALAAATGCAVVLTKKKEF